MCYKNNIISNYQSLHVGKHYLVSFRNKTFLKSGIEMNLNLNSLLKYILMI